MAFCGVILSRAAKPFCHLLIRTERSRGTETKREGKEEKGCNEKREGRCERLSERRGSRRPDWTASTFSSKKKHHWNGLVTSV